MGVRRQPGTSRHVLLAPKTIERRRLGKGFGKHMGKIIQPAESRLITNIRDRTVRFPQQFFCMIQPQSQQILIGSEMGVLLKNSAKMKRTHAGLTSDLFDVYLAGEKLLHVLNRPLYSQSMELFGTIIPGRCWISRSGLLEKERGCRTVRRGKHGRGRKQHVADYFQQVN
jgi:hypothetical protein